MPYVVPPDPFPPPVIKIDSTAVQSGSFVRAHRKSLREREEWLNIEQSVKKKIQEALPRGDIFSMWDLRFSLQNMQDWDLLAHTIKKWPIDPFMISSNKARLEEAWDASAPFSDLVERAFKVQEFASDVGRPIGDE